MNTFKKEERLCSRKLISELMRNRSSFLVYPFRVVWMLQEKEAKAEYPAQILISVAKKRFKRANKRNRLKRLIRESYRLNKQVSLYEPLNELGKQLVFMCSYIANEELPYSDIEKKMIVLLERLEKETAKTISTNHVE